MRVERGAVVLDEQLQVIGITGHLGVSDRRRPGRTAS